jgi:hypothetical protein
MNARAAIAAVLGVAIAVAACGNDAPTAPRIATLRLSPEGGVRPGELLTVTVDVIDEDGDVAGGNAEIGLLRRGTDEGELFRVPLNASGEIKQAKISLDVRLPPGSIPGRYDISVVILDAATRRSNPLVTEFEILM